MRSPALAALDIPSVDLQAPHARLQILGQHAHPVAHVQLTGPEGAGDDRARALDREDAVERAA